nr:MAG: internal scaffolding protein [Microvirus sp.]
MSNLRIPYVYDADAVSRETALICPEETLTRQEFARESDINTIVELFGIGEHPIESGAWVTNIDIVDAVDDFQTALNKLNEARDQFASLPARVRSRFDNDPARFVDFVSDANNIDEMVELGLAQRFQDTSVAPSGADGTGSS